ncbi:MAG: dTMP kinase [Candidatus Latescibacteria bacterium]|mgnify:CR=1 FL=1|nr:dTMP kinase [Candidatus Latescibacterota bacterium]MBT4136447.1 dTMP kinase [Candidatus Latescibacterota bacterium]MBT5832230.1 dTMP kinase [Candidatus Latescibacterota bacterium]
MAGFFISFEGIDKSGKSTQAARLVRYLQEAGREVVFTHEPGGTELGQELRHLALNWKPQNSQSGVDPTAEIFLFAADRAQHVAEIIQPALEEGKIVVTDRYVDSTLAYQGYGRGLDLDQLEKIQQIATGGLLPDLTVWVDVDLATSRGRLAPGGADRMESEDDALFESVREGYGHLSLASPNRFLKVDGTRTIDDIFEEIRNGVEARLA